MSVISCQLTPETKTGRYIVRLPLKSEPSLLGDSRLRDSRSRQFTVSIDSRKGSHPIRHFDNYTKSLFKNTRTLGHMVAVDTSQDRSSLVYYLPHHGGLRENSSTTKMRVVFNGSNRTNNGRSLNDILYSGAKLQADISEVLLWICTHRILFSTDIEKMFRQIAVHPEDWDLERILWYPTKRNALLSINLSP